MEDDKVAVVTEYSSGIGLSTALKLAAKGNYKVYLLADRKWTHQSTQIQNNLNDHNIPNLTRKEIDLQSESEVTDTVNDILSKETQIDALVLDTGSGSSGPLEYFSVGVVENLLETCVYRVIRILKLFIPVMRSNKKGHVLFISSTDGISGTPFKSLPCLVKFAVEGLAQSLAVEMYPFNIKISLVQPGPVLSKLPLTIGSEVSKRQEPCDSTTESLYRVAQEKQMGIFKTMGQRPEDVGDQIVDAISTQHPHFRYITNKLHFTANCNKLLDFTGDAAMANIIDKFVS